MSTSDQVAAAQPPALGRRRIWAGHDWRILIAGALSEARNGERRDVISPVTEEIIASVPMATHSDVRTAVAAAVVTAADMRRAGVESNSDTAHRLAEVVRAHAHELAVLDAFDGGYPVTVAGDGLAVAADLVEKVAASPIRRPTAGPVGLVLSSARPLAALVLQIGAALATGRPVIVVATGPAPLSALRVGEIIASHPFGGAISVLTASSAVALLNHPSVADKAVMGDRRPGLTSRRRSFLIGRADHEPESVISAALASLAPDINDMLDPIERAPARLIVDSDRYTRVVKRLPEVLEAPRLGDPTFPGTELGPLPTADSVLTVRRMLDSRPGWVLSQGVMDGAGFSRGYWCPPTVIAASAGSGPFPTPPLGAPLLLVQPATGTTFRDSPAPRPPRPMPAHQRNEAALTRLLFTDHHTRAENGRR